MRVSQLAEQYLLLRRHQSKKHQQAIRRVVHRFIECNGDIQAGEISTEHISQFLAKLGQYVRSSHSLRDYMTILKAILHEGLDAGIVARLPRFPRIRVEKRLPDAWTREEVERLFKYVTNLPGRVGKIPARLWWASILLAAYYTGLRLSGLMSITWWQVDLRNRYLRALTNKNKLEQVFAIPDDLYALLLEIQNPPREKVWWHPYAEEWPCRALRRIVDAAGIPAPKNMHGQLFQKMRRTCITWTAVADLSLATRVAGHASPDTTIRHYVDPRMFGAIQPVVPQIQIPCG